MVRLENSTLVDAPLEVNAKYQRDGEILSNPVIFRGLVSRFPNQVNWSSVLDHYLT